MLGGVLGAGVSEAEVGLFSVVGVYGGVVVGDGGGVVVC